MLQKLPLPSCFMEPSDIWGEFSCQLHYIQHCNLHRHTCAITSFCLYSSDASDICTWEKQATTGNRFNFMYEKADSNLRMKSRRWGINAQLFTKQLDRKSIVDSHNFVQLSNSIKHNNSLVNLQLISKSLGTKLDITILPYKYCYLAMNSKNKCR